MKTLIILMMLISVSVIANEDIALIYVDEKTEKALGFSD